MGQQSGKGMVVVERKELDKLQERWQKAQKNQITVIERLTGIIENVRVISDDPTIIPEAKVLQIQELLK